MWRRHGGWAAALLVGGLAACGGGGSGSGGPVIDGGVVKGPVSGASVCVYALSGGTKGARIDLSGAQVSGGCYVTQADGLYRLELPAGTTGEVLVEATGGRFCSNEVPLTAGACAGGGAVVDLTGTTMSGVVSAAPGGAAVGSALYLTPLTTAAVNAAAAGAGLSAANFGTQFAALASQVLGANSPVQPGTPPTPANQPYLQQVATHLQTGGSMGTAVAALQQGSTNFGGASANTPATVNAALAGSYSLVFKVGGGEGCGSVCSYTDGQTVAVTVHADGRLELPSKTLSQPFYRNYGSGPHLPEAIWLDADAQIEYALSDNEGGTFNEINVGDAGRKQGPLGTPTFLGQLRKAEASAGQVLGQAAGTYSKGQQYAGANVAWTSFTLAADGAVTFQGAGPSIASVQTVTSRVTCCNRIDIFSTTDINGVAGVTDDDKISLFLNADGTVKDVEYFVGASNVSTSLRGVSVVAGGASLATLPAPGTGTWAIPGGNAISGTVGSGATTVAIEHFTGSSGGFQMSGASGADAWLINVDPATAALQTGVNYSCVHGARAQSIQFSKNGAPVQAKNGGNCNIYLTRLEMGPNSAITAVEGRFVAEMYDYKHAAQALVLDGAFKYEAP